MKTSELIGKLLEIDSVDCVDDDRYDLSILKIDKSFIACVSTRKMYGINLQFHGFKMLPEKEKRKIYKLLTEYVTTPLEEREGQKRYKLRHKLVSESSYLNYIEDEKGFKFSTGDEIGRFKTTFTMQEWETLTEKTWEDLLLQFKAIEV